MNGVLVPFSVKHSFFAHQDKDGNILVKNQDQNATVSSDVNYKNRVSIKQDFSLVITQVAMTDQRTFTCMVVLRGDILEYPVQLAVYSEYHHTVALTKML